MGQLALACERFGDGLGGFLGQPANSLTSVSFLLAGAAVLAQGRSRSAGAGQRWAYPLLVGAVGVGSLMQHGPHPPWQAYAHDLPLASLLAFVAADCAADLTGRRRVAWWWLPVPVVMVPVVAAGPLASSVAQGALAAAAIGLGLARVRRRPALRRTVLTALGLLGAGALAGTLGERTALCHPDTLLQGHAAWHLLAAGALWWLAPAIGSAGNPEPGPPARRPRSGGTGSGGPAARRPGDGRLGDVRLAAEAEPG